MRMTSENIRAATARAAAQGKRLELADDDHAGLELGISPHGVRRWSLRVRDTTGRLRRFGLGSYPKVGLAAARRAARAERGLVEAGHDPIAERRAKRSAGAALRAGIGTLKQVFDLYEEKGQPPPTWFTAAGRKRVERVFGSLMAAEVAGMTPGDIMRVADDYHGRQAAENAIRALRPVLSWAASRDHAPTSLLQVKPGGGVPERDRVLSSTELQAIIPVLTARKTPYSRAMLFILLTLARRGEAAGATWQEIDLDEGTWTIPVERQKDTKRTREGKKGRQPFVIPLSRQALILLRKIKSEGVQTGIGDKIFRSRGAGEINNWDREQNVIYQQSGTAGWHRHDLRRTGATMMASAGVPPHVVEAALNHATIYSDLAGRYNKWRYPSDVKEALQSLANAYDRLFWEWREAPDEYGEPEMTRFVTLDWSSI